MAKALNAPPTPEDDGLLAMQQAYFQRAAALTYRESLSPRLRKPYDFLYIPELLRKKLDEDGTPWEDALAAVAARCSFTYVLPATPVPFFLLAHTQPRVAKLVQVLSDDFSRRLAAFWPDKPRRCAELAIIRDDFLYPDALALAFCGQISASWKAISGPLRPYYVFMPDKLKEQL